MENLNITTDKRFLKSKYAIEHAIEYLYNAGRTIASMTVSEITKIAKIARKTFYLHYVDLNDFLTQFGEEQIEIFKQSCLCEAEDVFQTIANSLINLTKTLSNNSLVKMLIVNQQYSIYFLTSLHNIIKDYTIQSKNSPFNDEYEVEFFASGIVSTYQYWIKNTNYASGSIEIETDIMKICDRISNLFAK